MTRLPIVLAIDDNPGDLTLLELAFSENQIHVEFEQEPDGDQALRRLERIAQGELLRPQVILLDLNMPRTNGHEVLRGMQRFPNLKGIPVVVLTTSSTAYDRAESMRLGAVLHLVKPVTFEQLKALLTQLLPYLDRATTTEA